MNTVNITTRLLTASLAMGLLITTGCSTKAANLLNPYAVEAPEGLGERNSRAILGEISGGGSESDNARHALEVLSTYRSTQSPQPTYPVVQPAEVRLMWVPDHVNRNGDLVPAHYYYLKVLNDRWAVQDAFEIEKQLQDGSSGAGSATPWVYK